MRFASSKGAKLLLKRCDAHSDGLVFDKDFQRQVLKQMILDDDSEKSDKKKGVLRITRSMSRVEIKIPKNNSKEPQIPYETAYEFFSKIPSLQLLEHAIETIFESRNPKLKPSADNLKKLSATIWKLYQRTEQKRKEKLASMSEGNHVRKVVKPMEDRMKMMDEKMDKMEEKIMDKMNSEMQEMKAKMNSILELLEKR